MQTTVQNLDLFDTQVLQIAALGAWHIITGHPMTARLEPLADERWAEPVGVFVTLRHGQTIRGNMGLLESSTDLQETLFDLGAAAATHDQRYSPVTAEELSHLDVEVRILGDFVKLHSPDDIVIGRTGVLVTRGEKQGLLLSHVAEDFKWNAHELLEAACEKAGLPHESWSDPNTLVELFSDRKLVAPFAQLVSPFVNLEEATKTSTSQTSAQPSSEHSCDHC